MEGYTFNGIFLKISFFNGTNSIFLEKKETKSDEKEAKILNKFDGMKTTQFYCTTMTTFQAVS